MDKMKDVVFVCCAFGDQRYIDQQVRLRASIFEVYSNANISFYTNGLPPGARPFIDSLYGLKVHAIEQARIAGFTKVIWLDPAMILTDKVDDLFNYKIVAIKDDNKLHNLISDKAANYFRVSKDKMLRDDWRLVGGSLYYFDFDSEAAWNVFKVWKQSEKDGMFGSQWEASTERINGHRNDESCMAVSMYLNGVEPIGADKVRYCIENNPMMIKKHFK